MTLTNAHSTVAYKDLEAETPTARGYAAWLQGCCAILRRTRVSAGGTHLKKQDCKGGSAVAGTALPSVLQDLHGHSCGRQCQAATKDNSSRASDIGQSHCCACHCCQCDHHLQSMFGTECCFLQFCCSMFYGEIGPQLDLRARLQLSEASRQGERAS